MEELDSNLIAKARSACLKDVFKILLFKRKTPSFLKTCILDFLSNKTYVLAGTAWRIHNVKVQKPMQTYVQPSYLHLTSPLLLISFLTTLAYDVTTLKMCSPYIHLIKYEIFESLSISESAHIMILIEMTDLLTTYFFPHANIKSFCYHRFLTGFITNGLSQHLYCKSNINEILNSHG